MPRGGPNQKAVAAKEMKAANQAVKDAEKQRQADAAAAKSWNEGANVRGASKAEAAAAKADEAARKKREKAALLAEEEANAGSGKVVKSKFGAASKKKGGKKNDLSLLEDSLVGAAEKKTKEKKRLEKIKREKEAKEAMQRQLKAKEEQAKKDPLLANTDAMIGLVDDDTDGPTDRQFSGRHANKASMEDMQGTGLDSALNAMSVNGGDDRHPEKRMKAAYKAYEEKMMPEMKQTYPGLKRQQYLDKIFTSWKKSPENPMNQV
mmetsp:Transcript_15088/g.22525  ORF Transcript_15088/g.22525 Transcript_15088/m.22525 type:complete len:263 (-) Transcript_15088:75-863(-)